MAQVDSVTFGKSRYRLRTPIEIRVYQEGELWYHEFEALEISAYGRTREESAEAFSERFSSIWHWIARVDDRKLGPEAVELKQRMLKLVKSVAAAP